MKATPRVRTAVVAALLGTTCLLSTGIAAQAAPAGDPGCGSPGDAQQVDYKPVYSTVNDDVANVYLFYSPSTKCVMGRVTGVYEHGEAPEIWLDRGSPSNYTGMLGKASIISPSNVAQTGWFNDNGVVARACGTSGPDDHDITCTKWY
ncbi:hypothetical protein [Fodinicola feengrottensis]|uniref:DUF2690 domain-containing protein n=1 Tax=Fodinicola feengrottensis TaxID=435914 RepID=A0ABN2G8L2_9ACTN|nr:hypothetical protein [Fodinicola feengrottensis]